MKLVAPFWYFELAFEADFTISIQAWVFPWLRKKKAKDARGEKNPQKNKFCSEKIRQWKLWRPEQKAGVSAFLGPTPGNEDRGVLEAKTSERLQQTYGGELNYLLNEKMKYSWSQLELDQILTLVIEYGKWFEAAVYVDEETEHVIWLFSLREKCSFSLECRNTLFSRPLQGRWDFLSNHLMIMAGKSLMLKRLCLHCGKDSCKDFGGLCIVILFIPKNTISYVWRCTFIYLRVSLSLSLSFQIQILVS